MQTLFCFVGTVVLARFGAFQLQAMAKTAAGWNMENQIYIRLYANKLYS